MEHLEGRQSILAALQAGQRRFQTILVRHGLHLDRVREILELAAKRGIPWRFAAREELDALAHGATHGGVLAICSAKPRTTVEELAALLERKRADAAAVADAPEPSGMPGREQRLLRDSPRTPAAPLLLLLEGVDDARNLGFTLRTADAFGADAVLVKRHLWDFDPVEVARPSAGAYERLPLVQVDAVAALSGLQKRGLRLIGCLAGAKRAIEEVELAGPVILAVGGEKRGLSGALRGMCDVFASIPTRRGAASLALAHAAAVVLAVAARQRRRWAR